MNLDDLATRKKLYRQTRRLLWSFVIALAFIVGFGLVQVAEWAKPWTFILFLVAAWVIAYHLIEWLKSKLPKTV